MKEKRTLIATSGSRHTFTLMRESSADRFGQFIPERNQPQHTTYRL